MEDTLDKLGLGKDCGKAVRQRFHQLRGACFKKYCKKYKISADKSLADWSKEECRTILRQMTIYFLHKQRGSCFWSEPARQNSNYILPKDRQIIEELLTIHFFIYINSKRRRTMKSTVRRKFLQGNGGSAERAIDVDDLSDDGLPHFVPESSPDRVPKREPVTDDSGIEQHMMAQQETCIPKQSAKRPAEAESPQAQSRAKSFRPDAPDSSVGLFSNQIGEEESLFVSDNEHIRDRLVGYNVNEAKSIHECDGLPDGLPAAANSEHAAPQTLEENDSAANAEPLMPQTLQWNNAGDVAENIQHNPPKDSAPERPRSVHDLDTTVCRPLREKVTISPYDPDRTAFEKETETSRKKTKANAVSRFRSRLDSPMYVPGQTYTPPVIRDPFVLSESSESSTYLETKTTSFTPDGIPNTYPDILFTNPPAVKDTSLAIAHVVNNKDDPGRAILDKTDKTEELPYKKAFIDSSLDKNPYQSVFKIPMSPEKGLPENQLNFDSKHAKHVLDSHLRNHAKATDTPIRFSFSVRHSNSHANRINNISSFDFFSMSLREFVVALPLKDKDQISGLCIRQYGPITHLRQVYLYNEDVFANIRDEFIRCIESDINDAKCTGKLLDYEISIEPIMDD